MKLEVSLWWICKEENPSLSEFRSLSFFCSNWKWFINFSMKFLSIQFQYDLVQAIFPLLFRLLQKKSEQAHDWLSVKWEICWPYLHRSFLSLSSEHLFEQIDRWWHFTFSFKTHLLLAYWTICLTFYLVWRRLFVSHSSVFMLNSIPKSSDHLAQRQTVQHNPNK